MRGLQRRRFRAAAGRRAIVRVHDHTTDQNVVFTPGAVTIAGQAKFTACNLSSSSTTFSGSIHLVAFRG